MDDHELLEVLGAAVDAAAGALTESADWAKQGVRPGQYAIDLAADRAAVAVLEAAGLGVLSEESGARPGRGELLAVLDPVDGSTNASRGIGWYATSVCVLDDEGPRASVVADQRGGTRWSARRGAGARRDGRLISPSGCTSLRDAVVGVNGCPAVEPGWSQFRALGAAALDICLVADGTLDAYWACPPHTLAPWDYLGAMLVCTEAGGVVADSDGGDLVARGFGDRRRPVAAATPGLLDQVMAAAG